MNCNSTLLSTQPSASRPMEINTSQPSQRRQPLLLIILLTLLSLNIGNVWAATIAYRFTSKSWAANDGNWISGKDGLAYLNNGVQITTGTNNAYATTPIPFTNISKVTITYCTNTSAGVGTISVFAVPMTNTAYGSGTRIGSLFDVNKPASGGLTEKTTVFIPSSAIDGYIRIQVTCATNSVYIIGAEIETTPSCTAPTLSFEAASISKTFGDASFTNTLVSSSQGAVSYSSDKLSVATVDPTTGQVAILGAGSCSITATQAADGNYCDATKSYVMTVNKATPTLAFAQPSYTYIYGTDVPEMETYTATPTPSTGVGTITYSSSNENIVVIDDKTGEAILGDIAGTTTITASMAATTNYNAATTTTTITINKADQTITFGALPTKTTVDLPFTLTATASSGLAVSYSSSDPTVASVVGSTVSILKVGTTTITATQVGNDNYNAAPSVSQDLTIVAPSSPYITVSEAPAFAPYYHGYAAATTRSQSMTIEGGNLASAVGVSISGSEAFTLDKSSIDITALPATLSIGVDESKLTSDATATITFTAVGVENIVKTVSVAFKQPTITIDPTTLEFGNRVIGGTYDLTAAIILSDFPADAATPTAKDTNQPLFTSSVSGNTLNIQYKPIASGAHTNSVEVSCGGIESTISVTATAILPTAATPTLPVSADFVGTKEIAITSAEGISIYYTVDGSDPTAASTLYTAPFTITETTTVQAIAAGEGYNTSEIASATYTRVVPVIVTPTITPLACGINKTATRSFTATGSNISGAFIATITDDARGFFSVSGTSPSFTVTYSPTRVGAHSASLVLSASGAADVIVSLSGTATAEPVDIIPIANKGGCETTWINVYSVTSAAYFLLDAGSSTQQLVSPEMDLSLYSGVSISYKMRTYGGAGASLLLEISENGGNYTTVTTKTPSGSTMANYSYDLSAYNKPNSKFRFKATGSNKLGLQDIQFTGTPAVVSITATPSAVDFGTKTNRGSYTSEIEVKGASLTGDIALVLTQGTPFSVTPKEGWNPKTGGTAIVTYHPTEEGTHSGTLTISSATDEVTTTVALSGISEIIAPSATVSIADITSYSAKISLADIADGGADLTGRTLYYKQSATEGYTEQPIDDTHSVTISSLKPATEYSYYVGLSNGTKIFTSTTTTFTTLTSSLSATPTAVTGLTYLEGSGPSSHIAIAILGANLAPANMSFTVDAANLFELSSDMSLYSQTITLPTSAIESAQTPASIYVRLKAGLVEGAYSSTITISGSNVESQTIALTGSVTAEALPPTAIDLAASELTTTSATLSAVVTSGSGALTKVSFIYATDADFTAPTAIERTESLVDGTISTAVTGLKPATTYYYKVTVENNETTNNSFTSTPISFTTSKIILSSDPTSVALTDGGSERVTISAPGATMDLSVEITGTDAALFTVDKSTLAKDGGDIVVTYSPTALGAHLAAMVIRSTEANDLTIALSGSFTALKPTSIKAATGITTAGFTANWAPVVGATEYEVKVEKSSYASDLIISEYVEGSSNNKYLEIYNGTGRSVGLANYKLELLTNGATTVTNTHSLSGELAHNATMVYKNTLATPLPQGVAAEVSTAANFNGDDAIVLKKKAGSDYINVDIFGVIGQRPSSPSAWTCTSPNISTLDKTLRRKSIVQAGIKTNPAFTSASGNDFATLCSEWDQFDIDVVDNLGSHTMSAGVVSILQTTTDATSITIPLTDPSGEYIVSVRAKSGDVYSDMTQSIITYATADKPATVVAENHKPISAAPNTTVTLSGGATTIPSATVGDQSTVVIGSTDATLTIESMTMEAGVLSINNTQPVTIHELALRVEDSLLPTIVNSNSNSTITATSIYVYRSFVANQYNPISFPFAISAIERKDGALWTGVVLHDGTNGNVADAMIQQYDGTIRASQGKGGWRTTNAIEAIKGYTFNVKTTGEYRFKATDAGSLFAVGGEAEIAVAANPVSDGRTNNAGWNFVGNPYADRIAPTMHYTACSIEPTTGKTIYLESISNTPTPQFAGYFVQVGPEVSTMPYNRGAVAAGKSLVATKEIIAMEYAGQSNSATSYIVTREHSTLGYELEADLDKTKSEIATHAEMWQREGGYDIAINDRPIRNTITTIPLAFKSGAAGQYRFRLSEITAPYQYSSIALVNTTTGESQELLQGDTALLTQGSNETSLNYELRISKVATGLTDQQSPIQVYASSSTIHVEGLEEAATIELIDLQGRTLYREDTRANSIEIARPESAILMVRITQADTVTNRKVQ